MLTVKEAKALIFKEAHHFGIEEISLNDAYGRVLAEDVYADRDYPPYNRAAMDGYAFMASDYIEKGIRIFDIVEEIFAGVISKEKITSGSCYKIMTGASVPLEADTLLRVEDTQLIGNRVEFKAERIKVGQNIAKRGEDKGAGDIVLKENTLLQSIHLSSLAVIGKSKIKVFVLPSVTIISTGDEVKEINYPVLSYQIRESNSYSLEGFLMSWGIRVQRKYLVPDNKEKLTETILNCLDSDILILSGGVSMGDADYVPEVLNELGIEKKLHKVAIKPGKPLWFGKSKKGVVFALPGNPFAVQVSFKIFIEPFIRISFGLEELKPMRFPLTIERKKKTKFDDYFPCILVGENITMVEPILYNGSGDVTSLAYSHGLALHMAEEGDLEKGKFVSFLFW